MGEGESDGLWTETGVRTWSLKWSLEPLSLTEGVDFSPVTSWLGKTFVNVQINIFSVRSLGEMTLQP